MTYYVVTDESRMSNIPFDPIMGLYGDAKRVHATRKDAQAVADTLSETGDWGDDTPPTYEVRETAMPFDAVRALFKQHSYDIGAVLDGWEKGEFGDLMDSMTGEQIRAATATEATDSLSESPEGHIDVNGRSVFVSF